MPDGVVIIGAGLAGLSTAYHLGRGCSVFEAQDGPGGLLRTVRTGGYSFDYTGHLLHLRDGYARKLVKALLGDNLREHGRRAGIFSKGVFTGYPFQANTYGLPADAAAECIKGFESAPGRDPGAGKPDNFRDWILHHFGDGIAKHFMLPYNRKLWQYDLATMAVEAIEPFVPVPTIDEVKRGATRQGAEGLGYNASFYYPEHGGIYSLIEAMLPHVKDLSLGQRAVEIDAGRRKVTFGTGYTAWYDKLISTMPLPELVRAIKDAPGVIKDAAEKLRYVSVYDINLGVARDNISGYHWIYFPEPEYAFYRAGFLSNFSAAMAPAGASSMYVEVSHRPGEMRDHGSLAQEAVDGLVRCGLLSPDDDVPVRDVRDMKYAYAVFDRHSLAAVPGIMEYLNARGITSIGRYGAWEYSAMEDAILAGKREAEALK